MKLKLLLIPLVGAALAFSAAGTSAQSAPSPTAGTKLTTDLISPRGMKIGPDGMIYVAEAGSAGDTKVGSGDGESRSGLTGRISKIDPVTGTRTTVVDKLPSNGGAEGDSVGPADVAFLNGNLYYVQTHGGAAYGFPDNPTGLYRVNTDGTLKLIADIGAYNIANPIADVKNGIQKDIEVGGNPYAMIARDGAFYITDGNQNQILKITPNGTITRMSEFTGHPVLTGIASADSGGPLYVSELGQGPFLPSDGRVIQVGVPTGSQTTIASGFSSMTDVEVGPGGQLYALSFGDFAPGPNGPPWMLGSAKIFKVDASAGKLVPLVTGFSLATSIIFSGDTAYVANFGVSFPGAPGEIWQIKNFSSIAPLPAAPKPAAPAPAAPTATPRAAIAAPNTGSGPANGGSGTTLWIVTLAAAALGAIAVGGGVAAKRH